MSTQGNRKIICEAAHADSIWCKQLLSGLIKEFKKRRWNYEEIQDVKEIGYGEQLYVIGVGNQWMKNVVGHCNGLDCVPVILSNQAVRNVSGKYHCVCADIFGVMEKLSESCQEAGRERVALYGISNASVSDEEQMKEFSELIQDASDIYRNHGNLETCFRKFLPYADRYDVVVCVNGYAAVSLVKKLEAANKELLEKLVIISCEEIMLSARYSKWISRIDLKLESFGNTAIAVMEMAAGRCDIASVSVAIEGDVCEIPAKMQEEDAWLEDYDESLLFADPEVVCMARIEQLLQESDETDNRIIEMLLANAKYNEIAESCFMTEGNVKYRVKKYMSICKVKTKRELLDLLQEYLP